jgi:hypothetical protein
LTPSPVPDEPRLVRRHALDLAAEPAAVVRVPVREAHGFDGREPDAEPTRVLQPDVPQDKVAGWFRHSLAYTRINRSPC